MPTITRLSLSCLAAALVAPAAAAVEDGGAWDYWVRAQPRVGFATLKGDASYALNGIGGEKLSVKDLGLGDRQIVPGIEVGIDLPAIVGLHFGVDRFAEEGTGRFNQTVQFGGKTYAAGTDITSSFNLTDAYGEISFSLPFTRLDLCGISLGLAVHALASEIKLESLGVSESISKIVPVPTASLRAYVAPFDELEIEGMAHGMTLSYADNVFTYVTAQLQAAYYPLQLAGFSAGIIGGYRYSLIDAVVNPSKTERATVGVTLTGPYVGVSASF